MSSESNQGKDVDLNEHESESMKVLINSLIRASKENSNIFDRISEDLYVSTNEFGAPILTQIKKDIKDLLPKKPEAAIEKLKLFIESESEKYDEVILLEGTFCTVQNEYHKGVIDFGVYNNLCNKFRQSFLYILRSLEMSDISVKNAENNGYTHIGS